MVKSKCTQHVDAEQVGETFMSGARVLSSRAASNRNSMLSMVMLMYLRVQNAFTMVGSHHASSC